jgi:hypothetical protein
MGPAVRQLEFVVDQRGWRQPPVLMAQFAQRVARQEPGAYLSPLAPVTIAGLWVTLVFVIASVLRLLMLFAEALVRQRRASRMTARTLGFLRHDALLGFWGKKAAAVFMTATAFCTHPTFVEYIIPQPFLVVYVPFSPI